MTFKRLSEYFSQLEATTLRNKMTEILASLFKEATAAEIGKLCYLLQGRVAPLFEAIEFGMADKMIIRAIAMGLDVKTEEVTKIFKKEGDLGKTVENIKNKYQKFGPKTHQPLAENISDVYDVLYHIATSGGEGSQEKKINLLGTLLKEVDPLSACFVVKITLNKLRLGFSDMTILDSLSWMLSGTKELRAKIEKAYNVRPDLGFISRTIKEKGIAGFKHVIPVVGTPILMTKAERMGSGADIIEKIGKCAVEPKYDGFRCIAGYTPLYVKDRGYISVRDVKVGDYVLTSKGRFKKVIANNKRIVDKGERVFLFQTYLSDSIKISEGHPILTWEKNQTTWKKIEEIKVGDWVAFPTPQLTEYSQDGIINPHLQLVDESGYQKEIPANNDFYRLLGFWIGDGFTNEFHNTERVGLLFNAKKEKDLAYEYKDIISSVLKIPKISESMHRGSLSIYWRDKPLRIWLSRYFRREWRGKMLPEWFSFIGKKQFLSFLRGWIESDGSLTHGGGYKIITKERDLAAFLQLVSLHYRIAMGLHKVRVKIKNYNFVGTYYELILPGTDRYIRVENDWIIARVLRNQQIKRDPRLTLYNLQVIDDESYCSGLVTLHNCQIHKNKNEVNIYSRNLENTTKMYPDIVEGVKKQVTVAEAIFEGEAIAFNPQTGEYLPFQETVQRRRKYNIEAKAKEIPLKLFTFDLLFVNGESLLTTPYSQRRERLEKVVKKGDDILIAALETVDNNERLEEIFQDAVSRGLEGIMAKKLDGVYRAGARDFNWIKYKRSYASKLDDTIDAVVMGFDFGQGKRVGFGIGDFLIGILDEKKDMFVTVAKIGTGLTDEEWKTLKVQSSKSKVQNKPKNYDVDKMMECDVWVEPKIVVEIRADEITRSPVHTAGRVMGPSKSGNAFEVKTAGLALRFPRLERFRGDKSPEDVTTVSEMKKMFDQQGKK